MSNLLNFKKNILITGHYGSGKTSFAVNLALTLKKSFKNICVVDLDTVNPYYRTSDYKDIFKQNEIKLISPVFANTNLDIPAITANIDAVIQDDDTFVILDIGGDDAGAIALGRYNKILKQHGYDLIYIFNKYRYLTQNAEDTVGLLREIEQSSRLKATYLVNNSNLGHETTLDDVKNSVNYQKDIENITKIPLLCSCIKDDIEDKNSNYYKIKTVYY